MNKKCHSCVFWGKKTKPGYRLCTNAKTVSQVGDDNIFPTKDKMQIYTSKNFGCIHWR